MLKDLVYINVLGQILISSRSEADIQGKGKKGI